MLEERKIGGWRLVVGSWPLAVSHLSWSAYSNGADFVI
jgi:hypothetical protein